MSSCNGNQHPTGRASSEALSSVDSSLSLKTREVADALLSLKNNDADAVSDQNQNFKLIETKKQNKKRKLQENKMHKGKNSKGNSDPLKSGDEATYKPLPG